MTTESRWFRCQPDADNPGWLRWTYTEGSPFNKQLGVLLVRTTDDRAIVRLSPHVGLTNFAGNLHGGAIMTFVDCALFVGSTLLTGKEMVSGVTVDLAVQFIAAARATAPVDTIVEITRETKRMIFLRGTVEQGDATVASFMGILRKPASE